MTLDDPHPLAGLDAAELRSLLEEGTDATWIFEPDSDRVVWSHKLFGLLGYADQPPGLEDSVELVHPADRETFQAAVEGVVRGGGRYSIAMRLRGLDGGYRGFRVRGLMLPARAGAPRRLAGFVLDATSEVEAKESLARSEARFRAFMDECPAAVFIKDDDGRHMYVNDVAARLVQVPRERILGRRADEFVPTDVAERLMQADRDVLASQRARSVVQRFRAGGGRTLHVLDVKFPVPDIDSDRMLIGGFGLDMTEQVEKDQALRALDRRIQDSQRLESIGLLAGGVAHDFNNILLTVMGNTELAMDEPDEAVRRTYLQASLDRCRKAAALCSQLLVYAGRSSAEPMRVEPCALVRESGELFDMSARAGVRMDLDIPDVLPEMLADPVQVRQVLLNLISNAVQAVAGQEDGRITIRSCSCACIEDHTVYHSWREEREDGPAELVCFVVEDNGRGMDQEQLGRMFEPFFSTHGPGRGLGMSTVLGIAKAHGGAVAVDSTPGEGTCVVVGFPIAREHVRQAAAPVEAARGDLDLSGKRILVVDDQVEVRNVSKRLIERLGAAVQEAESGEEALRTLAADHRFDAALVDVTMPGMSGIELADAIRGRYPETVVVLSSGYAEEGDDPEDTRYVFLRKPYGLASLQAALRVALGGGERTPGT